MFTSSVVLLLAASNVAACAAPWVAFQVATLEACRRMAWAVGRGSGVADAAAPSLACSAGSSMQPVAS